jgi:hypothetical protein
MFSLPISNTTHPTETSVAAKADLDKDTLIAFDWSAGRQKRRGGIVAREEEGWRVLCGSLTFLFSAVPI